MGVLETVTIGSLRLERFESVLPADRYAAVRVAAERARRLLEGRVVWNVNSTARGGGVAEMLISLLAYAHGAGVDARWLVIPGSDPFFTVTKRVHNNLHSVPGDGGDLGDAEREQYEQCTCAERCGTFGADGSWRRGDRSRPAAGRSDPSAQGDRRARDLALSRRDRYPGCAGASCLVFPRPYVEPRDAYVFSREAFVWEGLDRAKIELIAPVIDAFSAKNQDLDDRAVGAILRVAGLNDVAGVASDAGDATFTREDGTPGCGAATCAAAGSTTVAGPGSDGAAGLALGPAEGSARRDPGLRRVHRAPH